MTIPAALRHRQFTDIHSVETQCRKRLCHQNRVKWRQLSCVLAGGQPFSAALIANITPLYLFQAPHIHTLSLPPWLQPADADKYQIIVSIPEATWSRNDSFSIPLDTVGCKS